jgi:bacteriocin biosynthesis cyclodehydratase domain-containing protein
VNPLDSRRPRLAWPCTIATERDRVHLVAGEDVRYTLAAPGLDVWLPGFLARLDGRPLTQSLLTLSPEQQSSARELVERLYGERLLVDAPAEVAHPAAPFALAVEGSGPLAELLCTEGASDRPALRVLCQDRLDYAAAERFNRDCRHGSGPWLWVTTGPLQRGYVSPVFLPDAGPCLLCLLRQFQRLSPAPELYDVLREHGESFTPAAFPTEGEQVLAALVRWKARLLGAPEPAAPLYRLHVLEVSSLEVSSHRVFVDPECPECG